MIYLFVSFLIFVSIFIIGLGLCSGVVMYTGAQWAKKLGYYKGKALNPNNGMLFVLSSFAFGTFFMASTTGKEVVHKLHPVFRAQWEEPPNNLSLPKLENNNYQQTNTNMVVLSNNNKNGDDTTTTTTVDPQRLREMRVTRRKSLMEALQQRGHGISDSHSGRWVEENSETKFEKK